MGKIHTRSAIVARVGRALIHIDLTSFSGEASRAEALGPVVDCQAKTTMLTSAFRTVNIPTFILGGSSNSFGLLSGVTLKAFTLSSQRLEEVLGARCAWSKSSVGIHSRRAALSALVS